MTHLARFLRHGDATPRLGVVIDQHVSELPDHPTLASLLREPLATIRALVGSAPPGGTPLDEVALLPPADGRMEVWAAGVTYERSRDARTEESSQASVYDVVYDAERPELFFKSVPWRVVTDGEPIGTRIDSGLDVAEPELAVVVNACGEVVGYTACNDVSSREIEGENPLYLPQAKLFAGSCALAPGIRPAWEVPDPHQLTIWVCQTRGSRVVWAQETSTASMRRRIPDLVRWLFVAEHFPDGAVLSTGTGLVPGMDVTLADGDLVRICITGVGSMSNRVLTGKDALRRLTPADARPARR